MQGVRAQGDEMSPKKSNAAPKAVEPHEFIGGLQECAELLLEVIRRWNGCVPSKERLQSALNAATCIDRRLLELQRHINPIVAN